MNKKLQIIIVIFCCLLLVGGAIGYYFISYRPNHLSPNSSASYYEIFDKDEILDGSEDNATAVINRLDQRHKKYQKTFAKMAGTNDEQKLKALFYMNFVHMYGYYGPRELKDYNFKHLLQDSIYFHCGTNTTFLAMLLDKAGFEFRTVSVGNSNHGFIEIKLNDQWQILDPTINTWIDRSFEELIANQPRKTKFFFVKGLDVADSKNQENALTIANILDFMLKMGVGYKSKIDQYDYINLANWQY